MNNYQNEANLSSSVIDLNKLITLIWNEKKTILLSVSIFIILSIGFSLILPDKYRSQVLLTSATETNQQNSLSSFGSLAGLAGISMPNSSNNSAIGIEILKSRIFLKKFIVDNNVAIPLMASKGWDHETKELIYDSKIYDVNAKKWVNNKGLKEPTFQEIYEFWIEKILTITEDKEDGFIRVEIEHYSPIQAQIWLKDLIDDLNDYMRNIDVDQAERSIEYLRIEADKTASGELKTVLYNLIQTNTEKKMLAYSRKDYLFRVIDPPIIPEKKSSPNRAVIVFSGIIFGFVLGVLIVIFRNRSNIINNH